MFLASLWQDEDVTICHHASYSVTHLCCFAGWRKQLSYIMGNPCSAVGGKAHLKDAFSIVWGSYFFAWACKIKIHWVVMIVTAVIKHLF